MDKKWNIPRDTLKDEKCAHILEKYNAARTTMRQRTYGHELFGLIAHGKAITKEKGRVFSEGSSLSIMRKVISTAIQRTPDGELVSKYDKNSAAGIACEALFSEKVLVPEYDNQDMFDNLVRTAMMSYQYEFAPVLTGFERDVDGDIRVSYKLIQWSDCFPDPDCDFINEAEWFIIRQYLSRDTLKGLLNDQGGISDSTWNEDAVKYIIENKIAQADSYSDSVKLADREKGVQKTRSVMVLTLYKRGAKEFTTVCPAINGVLRTVKNYDPRKDLPVHIMTLFPDPDFPLGDTPIRWNLGYQQFADGHLSSSYKLIMMAPEPPLKVYGNKKPKIEMKPNALWMLGANPNMKLEPHQIETSTLMRYDQILQQTSAAMDRNVGTLDGTVAADAAVPGYSKTPQGVEAQRQDRTVSINAVQKRIEIFFSQWASHALRSYVNAMKGEHWITVSEKYRRRMFDAAGEETVDGNKILIDFSELSADSIDFKVRAGSLMQDEKQQELENIMNIMIPLSQMLNSFSEETGNKRMVESDIIMPLLQAWLEKAPIDISAMLGRNVGDKIMENALYETMQMVQQQQGQIDALAQNQMAMQGAMPPDQQAMMEQQQAMPPADGMPMEARAAEEAMPTEEPAISPEQLLAQEAPAEIPMEEVAL